MPAGVSRRGFLKVSLVGAAALAGGAGLAGLVGRARYRRLIPAGAEPRVLGTKELAVLAAFVDRVLPDEPGRTSAREARVAERIDREIAFGGARLQRDVKNALFL